MLPLNPTEALTVLGAELDGDLVELEELRWFDAKSQPHRLGEDHQNLGTGKGRRFRHGECRRWLDHHCGQDRETGDVLGGESYRGRPCASGND
jgi:hypothetical protein